MNVMIVDSANAAAAPRAQDVCAEEPIRIPGAIQPHGYLLTLDDAWCVTQVSANIVELTGKRGVELLGCHVADVIGASGAALIVEVVQGSASVNIVDQPLYIGRVVWSPDAEPAGTETNPQAHTPAHTQAIAADASDAVSIEPHLASGARLLDLLLHRHDGILFLEIEPTGYVGNVFSPIYALVRTFVARLQDAHTIEDLSRLAASELRAITGFGRVLVYRFDDEGHGEVLAEDLAPGYASYLHQFFPASDIPEQARALYLAQRLRLIADVDYTPVPLVPVLAPSTGEPTDLSYASLRSVSPVHLAYMRNMGTASSMSISIIVGGRLWGLISCHHHSRRIANFETRAACAHLGEVLSLQIDAKQGTAEANHRLALRHTLVDLIASMADRDDFVDSLLASPTTLMRFMAAHGVAIVHDGRIATAGITPGDEAIRQIADFVAVSSNRGVYHTDSLAESLPEAHAYASVAAGVLAVQISKLHRHFVLWFRPEVERTIEWAGDPHKTAINALTGALSPRESFASWKEIVRLRALRWRPSEIDVAEEFRSSVLGIVLRRAEEMASIAAELGRVNKELEAFSYSVSHDLRAPLRHIVGYGDLLQEYEGERLSDRGRRFLQNIGDSARFAGTLVDDLLTFSQMGRAALRPGTVDLRVLVDTIVRELNAEYAGALTSVIQPGTDAAVVARRIDWQIGDLPNVHGDPAFLMMALRNLLSNAVKYTKTRTHAIIQIDATQTAEEHIIAVRDNGVGFNMRYVNKLFGVFQRLHRAEDFEGTGIGLANVRRIIDRHDGKTWAEGVLDQGASFYFSLPKVRHDLYQP